MTRDAGQDRRDGSSRPYPPLDPALKAALDAKLVAVVALRHRAGLTTAQLADLAAAIEQQTRHLETLHRFPLSNADEPAFVRAPLGAPG